MYHFSDNEAFYTCYNIITTTAIIPETFLTPVVFELDDNTVSNNEDDNNYCVFL